jgi:hypothetical protein
MYVSYYFPKKKLDIGKRGGEGKKRKEEAYVEKEAK